MAGFTTAHSVTMLNLAVINGDKIQWSENGSSASTHVAATAITAWDGATSADPSLRKNTGAVDSSACDADSITITHFAIWDTTGAVQKTDWTTLSSPRTLMTGDKLSIAALAIVVSLT
jgi:GTP cyclohydrolase III